MTEVVNMRWRWLCFLSVCWSFALSAQQIVGGLASAQLDSIPKTILEPAGFLASYKYQYVMDPETPDRLRIGQTFLQVGERYTRFGDFYQLQADSLMDAAYRGELAVNELMGLYMGALRRQRFDESTLHDSSLGENVVQRTVGGSQRYEYREPAPTLQWELLPGDSVVAGYACHKARTSMHGRDYIAWYSTEINLPYGPYKFYGLPGLVLKVSDTQGHYLFELEGFEQVRTTMPIYKWAHSDITRTSRKRVRQIYKNYCADPAAALLGDGSVTVSAETRAQIKARLYNPIELD